MRKIRRAAITAAVLTAGAVIAVPSSNAGAATTSILSGTVTQDGTTPASGATVTLVAWPNADYLAAQAEGATVPTLNALTTSTASNGTFTASPDLSAIPAMYHEPDGAVNFEVDVVTASGATSMDSTYLFSGADITAPAADSTYVATTNDPMTATLNVANGTATTATARSKPSTGKLVQTTMKRTTVTPRNGGIGCGPDTVGPWTRGAPERFMRVYALTGASAHVTEKSSSSHSLGYGVKIGTDAWGAASGSTDMDTEIGGFAGLTYNSNTLIFNRIDYRDYIRNCNGGGPVVTRRRAVKFVGLENQGLEQSISAPLSWAQNRCQQVSHAQDGSAGVFGKDQGSNVKFSVGIDLGAFSVASQATYSSSTEEVWSVKSDFQLCSSNSNDWLHAPQAAMLPRNVSCTSGSPCATDRKPN